MSQHGPSMQARSLGPSGSAERSLKVASPSSPLLPSDAKPESTLDRIRELVTDHALTARRLATEAAARFPDHPGIQNARKILDGGRARPGEGGAEPAVAEEFEWLRQPPAAMRGKWVALVGKQMVASADSLAELTQQMRSMSLSKPALVHQID